MESLQNFFPTQQIIINDSEEFMYDGSPRINIINEDKRCISFYIIDDTILTDGIDRCSKTVTTKEFLLKLVDFAKYINIKKITIGSDGSRLIFKSNKRTCEIYLKYIFLLKYGQTYYNKIGFGTQNNEWFEFINIKIKDTKLKDIHELQDSLDEKICDYFNNIQQFLLSSSIRDQYNLVDEETMSIIVDISKLMIKIFKTEKKMFVFVPQINTNLNMFL